MKTVRGAFLLLFTLGFFALMIGPQVMMAVMMGNRPELQPFAGASSPFATPALFAFTLLIVFTSAGEAAVYFAPAEVDFLFSAPVHAPRPALLQAGAGPASPCSSCRRSSA